MANAAFSIQIQTRFVPEQSDPDKGHYLFAYTIRIQNVGQVAGQLISRHWVITDANNRIDEVRGLGVVGNQPLLQPGQSFEYTSACPLQTNMGSMRGTFHFVTEQGAPFEVAVPEFALALPRTLH